MELNFAGVCAYVRVFLCASSFTFLAPVKCCRGSTVHMMSIERDVTSLGLALETTSCARCSCDCYLAFPMTAYKRQSELSARGRIDQASRSSYVLFLYYGRSAGFASRDAL